MLYTRPRIAETAPEYLPLVLTLADREECLFDGLSPAQRASAWFPGPFPLRKNETASPALCRCDNEMISGSAGRLPDVLKMVVHFPL